MKFCFIFHLSPTILAFGKILVVILSGVVDGVEEVFKIVERHTVERKSFLLGVIDEGRTKEEKCGAQGKPRSELFHDLG